MTRNRSENSIGLISSIEMHDLEAQLPSRFNERIDELRPPKKHPHEEGRDNLNPTEHHGFFRGRGDSRLRILMVGHGLETARLAFILRLDGHRIVLARAGPSALRKARADPTDVVLLDMSLLGMNGWEVGQQLWAHQTYRRPLMIAVAQYSQPVDPSRAQEAGIHLNLVKPVDPVFLLKLLRRFEAIILPEAHLEKQAPPRNRSGWP